MNWQIQLTKNVDTLPLARDYMIDAERNSTAKDDMADGLVAIGWDRQRELS
jgi:cyclopropane-fatty-acyl-phospholipid synthase